MNNEPDNNPTQYEDLSRYELIRTEEVILYLVRSWCLRPDEVRVTRTERAQGQGPIMLRIGSHPKDGGRIIGKGGKGWATLLEVAKRITGTTRRQVILEFDDENTTTNDL